MTNAKRDSDGVPPPLPLDPVEHERVFPVAGVCSVTTKNGAGHGILCTLKGAPCVLTPAHVLGEAEDEPHPGLFDRHERETRVLAARRARVFVAHRLAGDGTVTENEVAVTRLKLLPEVFFAFSPAPAPGRPPDANRMDYALCACDVETHTSETEGDDSQNTLSAVSSSKRADFKKRTRAALFTRALEDAQPSETCEPGDELHLGACVGKETRVSDVAWRRGFVTAPPRRRRDDEAYPYAAGLGDIAASRGVRATRVSLRYDARTVSGESGAAVTSAPRRAFGELDADFAARRKAAHALGSRGRGALVAMHRAGGEGEDGEGVMVCEILRDVKETLAVGKVRDAAEEGNAAVAVAELAREPRTSSRGARSRAAAAAAEVVASLPEQAVQAMAMWIDRGGYVAVGPARVAAAAEALEQALCDWVAFDPTSARLAAGAAHALGALARARMRPSRGGGAGDACVIETLDRHYANEAVREKARWAHRVRSAAKA